LRNIRRASAAIQGIIADITAQIIIATAANQHIGISAAHDHFDAGLGIDTALAILRLACA
jgi:hypothetical protein